MGNIDAGILAASWSPDDTLLVLATGTLRCMRTNLLNVESVDQATVNSF